jgi:hypothetical protein
MSKSDHVCARDEPEVFVFEALLGSRPDAAATDRALRSSWVDAVAPGPSRRPPPARRRLVEVLRSAEDRTLGLGSMWLPRAARKSRACSWVWESSGAIVSAKSGRAELVSLLDPLAVPA